MIRHLRRDDYICSTYRDHVHALSKDVPAREIMAELFGKKTGICRGQGGSMHMFSSKYNLVRLCAHARALFCCHHSTCGGANWPAGLASADKVRGVASWDTSILWLHEVPSQTPSAACLSTQPMCLVLQPLLDKSDHPSRRSHPLQARHGMHHMRIKAVQCMPASTSPSMSGA